MSDPSKPDRSGPPSRPQSGPPSRPVDPTTSSVGSTGPAGGSPFYHA